jgi:sulfate transport system substrate-binding protein
MQRRRRAPVLTALTAALVSLVLLAGCGSSSSDTKAKSDTKADASATADAKTGGPPLAAAKLSLVAYSTPQEAYGKIIKAFQATTQGKNITFTESYGASGDQSRAVEAGLAADVVAFSLEPDMTRLVKAGLVDAAWSANDSKGMVTDSVVALVTRKGNPKHVKDWDDLVKPGVEVITPNPFTSGGARWNVMAAYGAKSNKGADDAAGVAYLNKLFHQVPVQDDSARKSLQTFAGGKGDVLIAYENEAIFAQQHGQAIDYVIPDQTILIENPVAVTSKSTHQEAAKAFVQFLSSPTAQTIFADAGYRPVTAGVKGSVSFKDPSGLFTIADVGGWTSVSKKFFDPQAGVLVDVERQLGVATSK